MAKSTQITEDELCCSICVDIFREPVSLTCHHSFCRECLRLLVDNSKLREDEDSDSHHINCPVCRSPTGLTHEDVTVLPVNKEMWAKVAKFHADIKTEDDTPKCSMCEDSDVSTAVMFCSNCDGFFCQDCLTALHPMRGPFKRHTVKPVNDLSAQKTTEGDKMTDKSFGSNPSPACDKHRQPVCIYCVTCRAVICPGCIVDHPKHSFQDIETASETEKGTFLDKVDHLTNFVIEIKDALLGLKQVQRDIKMNEDLHTSEIEKAYSVALDILDSWKRTSLEVVKKKHSSWSLECATSNNDLEMLLKELQTMQQSCQNLSSCPGVNFLQVSKQFTKSIDHQLTEIGNCLKKHGEIKRKLEKCVNGDPAALRHVLVKEEPRCAKPYMRFTETANQLLRITDNGSTVRCGDMSLGEPGTCTALTDGRYNRDRHYWEVEVSVLTSSSDARCYCAVGVVQDSCDLRRKRPGSDSWYIVMVYRDDKVKCCNRCGGDVEPAYQQRRPDTGPQHLGLYLNCEDRTLAVLDCDNSQLMFTVSGLNTSEPLVPFVQFCWVKSGSARLITGHSVSPPQVIFDTINDT